ncbi:hypothetical protein BS78_10G077900 [Paspalum vaginatum]|nr:hypothetical protein BS78_10G077900 [Paspalum vaginatum]
MPARGARTVAAGPSLLSAGVFLRVLCVVPDPIRLVRGLFRRPLGWIWTGMAQISPPEPVEGVAQPMREACSVVRCGASRWATDGWRPNPWPPRPDLPLLLCLLAGMAAARPFALASRCRLRLDVGVRVGLGVAVSVEDGDGVGHGWPDLGVGMGNGGFLAKAITGLWHRSYLHKGVVHGTPPLSA